MKLTDKIELLNEDNMAVMSRYPDKYFDLAIVDPPYGSDNIVGGYTSGKGGGISKQKEYHKELWNQAKPSKEYFMELIRVSKNVIIWGANHFIERIPNADSSSWIVWDKDNGDNSFADCELAYTSHSKAVRKYKFKWQGMLQENMKNKEIRIHPTQKPRALYEWILNNYAKPDFKILDTHLGSGSIAIASHYFGCELVGTEIDKDYYEAAVARFKEQTRQFDMFQTLSISA